MVFKQAIEAYYIHKNKRNNNVFKILPKSIKKCYYTIFEKFLAQKLMFKNRFTNFIHIVNYVIKYLLLHNNILLFGNVKKVHCI